MKPFHFYLFLFFAYWLQPQVLPAQDNRLAKHPFSQDSWYRADSMKYFYLHAHKLRPIHRGAGGHLRQLRRKDAVRTDLFPQIRRMARLHLLQKVRHRNRRCRFVVRPNGTLQPRPQGNALRSSLSGGVWGKSDGTARMLHPRRDSWQTRHARQHRPRRQALRLPPLLQATSQ